MTVPIHYDKIQLLTKCEKIHSELVYTPLFQVWNNCASMHLLKIITIGILWRLALKEGQKNSLFEFLIFCESEVLHFPYLIVEWVRLRGKDIEKDLRDTKQ